MINISLGEAGNGNAVTNMTQRPGTTVEKSFDYSGHTFPPAIKWEYLPLGISGPVGAENGYDSSVQIKSIEVVY